MKKLKQVFLFITLLVLTCSMATQVQAKTVEKNKVTTLKQNKYTNKKSYDYSYSGDTYTYTYYWYKIVIPSDGYITISIKNSSYDSDGMYIFDNAKEDYTAEYKYVKVSPGTSSMVALDKGTYYIKGSDSYSFKYKFTKSPNVKNYCIAKATTLTSRKNVTVCNTSSYFYDRWYKVVLKKKQQIKLNVSVGDGYYIKIVSSKLESYDMANDGNTYYTQKSLPKGTYYIRVSASEYSPLISFYLK